MVIPSFSGVNGVLCIYFYTTNCICDCNIIVFPTKLVREAKKKQKNIWMDLVQLT